MVSEDARFRLLWLSAAMLRFLYVLLVGIVLGLPLGVLLLFGRDGTPDCDPSARPRASARLRAAAWLARAIPSLLGGSFVKLAQVLGQQPEFVGDAIAASLRRLQDGGRPKSPRWARRQLAKASAPTVTGLVWRASASTAAVFEGLLGAERVAVKIVKPAARIAYALDHALFRATARVLGALSIVPPFKFLQQLEVPTSLRELADSHARQLDLRVEAENANKLRGKLLEPFNARYRAAGGRVTLCIPEIQFASRDLMLSAWFDGESARSVMDRARAAKGAAREEVIARYGAQARAIIDAQVYMVLRVELGQGDPHAGNVLFEKDGDRVCLLDFGLVFELPAIKRLRLAAALLSLAASDAEGVARQLVLLSPHEVRHSPAQRRAFIAAISELIVHVHRTVGEERSSDGLPLGDLVFGLMRCLRQRGVRPDPGFTLVNQSLVAAQGFIAALAPKHNLEATVQDEIVALYRALGQAPAEVHTARMLLFPPMLSLCERSPRLAHELADDLRADGTRELSGRLAPRALSSLDREMRSLDGEDHKAFNIALVQVGTRPTLRSELVRECGVELTANGHRTVNEVLAPLIITNN